MPVSIDFERIMFAEPIFLWLLILPALLFVMWVWRVARRRSDIRPLVRQRTIPVRERFATVGDLPFWLCLIIASAILIVALARPQGPATAIRQGGVDIVILQDGSASMQVKDVTGDRWQRSIRFLRVLGDSLSWNDDRIALALFAHIASPQIRLTNDPNTFFFFIDHLDQASPFRIEDETSWDTNLELGIYWGLRLIERDEELQGKSPNARVFLMISDGESWSGEVEQSIMKAVELDVPLFVVGVGTLGGARMPEFKDERGNVVIDPETPITSRLDRSALQRIAATGAPGSISSSIGTVIGTSRTRSSTPAGRGRPRSAPWSRLKIFTGGSSSSRDCSCSLACCSCGTDRRCGSRPSAPRPSSSSFRQSCNSAPPIRLRSWRRRPLAISSGTSWHSIK